ncbi:hypothetical protein [Salipaludibacillus sp. CF4.18]|uniref:hypothetical protein n=1 Tax=Salipaludibacillus sp. CF4.18 TaxID=3373081 RepID=UPI003EE8132C
MGHLLVRMCMLLSILMFGFILGIIYQNEGLALYQSNFEVIEEEVENDQNPNAEKEDEPLFTLKEKESNIIDMEDDNGIVVYDGEGGDEEFHQKITHESSTYGGEESSLLFSEMGERTSGMFESVFQGLFRTVE